MVSPTTQKILIGIVAIFLLGFLAYREITKVPDASLVVDPNGEAVGQDILNLAREFESTSIDRSLFSSPLFTSLVDFSVALYPEPQGRPNPFAPLSSGATAPASSGQKSTSSL